MSFFTDQKPLAFLVTTSALLGVLVYVLGTLFAATKGLNFLGLMGDAKGYMILAEHMREFGVFSFSNTAPFSPESFRAPGYPAFLAILLSVFREWWLVMAVQTVMVSIAPALLYVLLRPYHERAAFWGSVLFVIEPIRLFASASPLSDMLFVCLFLLSLLSLEKGRLQGGVWWFIASGVLLGASILVRPIAMFLPLLYGVYVLWMLGVSKRSLRFVAVLCVAALVVVGPWMYRNHTLFHSWSIASVGSANLMLYNAPEFLKYAPSAHAQAVYDAFMLEQNALSRDEALSLARSSVFTDTFRLLIQGNEMTYITFHILKTVPFFVTDGLRDTIRLFGVDIGTMPNISTALLQGNIPLVVSYILSGGLPILLLVFGSGFWAVVVLLWLYTSGVVLRARLWPLVFFFVVLVGYFALLTGPVSNARYRLPVEGFLLVAAVGVCIKTAKAYDTKNI